MKKFIFTLLLMLPLSLMAQVQMFMDIPVVSVEQYTAELIEKGFVEVESKDSTQTNSAAVNMKTLKGKYLDEEVDVVVGSVEKTLIVQLTFSPKEGYAIEGRIAEIAEKYEKVSGIKFKKEGESYNFYDVREAYGVAVVSSAEGKVDLMFVKQ